VVLREAQVHPTSQKSNVNELSDNSARGQGIGQITQPRVLGATQPEHEQEKLTNDMA
jgi:predicted Zn-dependent protease